MHNPQICFRANNLRSSRGRISGRNSNRAIRQINRHNPREDARPQTPVHIFTGTIAKSGEKFVLQESSGGNTYDIDRQDIVKDLEGKKVRVHGILDPDGKTIHVQ